MLPKTCSIPECGKPFLAKGFCNLHYKRAKDGRPMDAPAVDRYASPEEAFAARTEWQGECLIWGGAINSPESGYGVLAVGDGRIGYVHRWAFERAHGTIPAGGYIDHTCHVKLCCNPDHLRLVTNKQNGENLKGARSGNRTGIRGVKLLRNGRFEAGATHNYVYHYGGSFETPREAERAAIALRNRLYTHNDLDRASSLSLAQLASLK